MDASKLQEVVAAENERERKTMETKRTSKRIDSIMIKHILDESPDSSYLGVYSDDASAFAIVATDDYEGMFVEDLPCECGHVLFEHGEDDFSEQDCRMDDCNCEEFERITPTTPHHKYRYFNSGGIEAFDAQASWIPANIQDVGDRRMYWHKAMRDLATMHYDTMHGLTRGDFYYIGIRAEAHIKLTGDLIQTITSGGLWGIESNSGTSFIESTEKDELDDLREQLLAVGFAKRAVSAAMRDVQRDESL